MTSRSSKGSELSLIAVGAANVDLVAEVDRIPLGDEEVQIKDLRVEPGGSSANVAVGVSRLGHRAGFVGKVGEDSFGSFLMVEFENAGVDTSHVIQEGRSGVVFAVVKEGERYLYTYGGSARTFKPEDIPEEYLKRARFLHLASIDSPQGVAAIEKAGRIGKEAGIKVIFDPGHLFIAQGLAALREILKATYAFLPSESEVEKLIGSSSQRAGEKLLEYGPKAVVITKGKRGCLLITEEGGKEIPAYRQDEVRDSVGAGDAFSAGFISALLEGRSLEAACDFANYIAAESLKRPGARSVPERAELSFNLEHQPKG